LNVWTSSTVTNATPNTANTKWSVTIKRGDGTECVFWDVKHVAFATGIGDGDEAVKFPTYPGMVRILFGRRTRVADVCIGCIQGPDVALKYV
jgi:cation diffusion facilitator CzcD-associated flavoprotein CzcO